MEENPKLKRIAIGQWAVLLSDEQIGVVARSEHGGWVAHSADGRARDWSATRREAVEYLVWRHGRKL